MGERFAAWTASLGVIVLAQRIGATGWHEVITKRRNIERSTLVVTAENEMRHLERRQNEAATTWLSYIENKEPQTMHASVCSRSEPVHPFVTLCTQSALVCWGERPRDSYRVRKCGAGRGHKTISSTVPS